jgi:CRISPR-associated protein Csd1
MLHALREYGQKLGGEPGFRAREVRWAVQLTHDGKIVGLLPLGDDRRGRILERCPDMHAMQSGGKAHFLVESAQTLALYLKADEDAKKVESARQRHRAFADLLDLAVPSAPELKPIAAFLGDAPAVERLRQLMRESRAKPTDWVTWLLDTGDPTTSAEVQAWWRAWRLSDLVAGNDTLQEPMVCLLSGELVQPLATHPKITGLAGIGGLAMGDAMVACDKAAFASFNLEKSANAAMADVQAQSYADGLNDLIRNHSRKFGNVLVAYWFKEQVSNQDDPLNMLHGLESEEQQAAAAHGRAKKLLSAIRSGARQDLGDNHFYAMALTGASGRVMVRDWMEGQFEQLVANVDAWFAALSIVDRDGRQIAPDPKFLAVVGGIGREIKEVPNSVITTLWHAAVANLSIPQPMMAQALHRFRLSVVLDELMLHARMGLIKAYFVRKPQGGDLHMKPYLNPEHPDPAYHCGRLLAVLAKLQHTALGDVGAGVVQRFYPAASQTPGLTLGRLVGNARNHLGKLDGGLAWCYEERIAEIMGRLTDQIPRTLDLEEQGLFALGYYQQLADLRAGKASKNTNTSSGDEQ